MSAAGRLAQAFAKSYGAWHKRLYNSFDENSSGTSPRVAIFRQIRFRCVRLANGERPHALDQIEPNLRDILCAQPFQNSAALKRNG